MWKNSIRYSKKVADEICERRAKGESIKKICEDEHMPSREAFYKWLFDEDKKYLVDNYALAIDIDAENIFDDLIKLAEECELDKNAINKLRLEIDTKKWVLSRRKPKKYGDKIRQEISGPDGKPIKTANANIEITEDMDPKEAMKLYTQLIKGEAS